MPDTPKKVLVVTLSNLGDVVLTLPVVQSITEAHPKAELHVAVSASSRAVFEGDKRVTRLIELPRRPSAAERVRFLRGIRAEKYDWIVDLRRSPIGFFGGAKCRNSYVSLRPVSRRERHLSALAAFGLGAPSGEPFLKAKASYGGIPAVEGKPYVAAAPGSKSDVKKWPAKHFARLLDKLAADGFRIVLLGDAADSPDAAAVSAAMAAAPIDLTGKTDFGGLASALRRASLVVTNDSAPLHIADSFGAPTLALFGPTDPAKYGPRGASSAALSLPLTCQPCESAQCRRAERKYECLEAISPERAYAEAKRLLAGETRKTPRILVVRLDRIGDLVLTLPSIEALRREYPHAHLAVMARPYTSRLLEGHPLIDEVIPYDYGKRGRHRLWGNLGFIWEIRRRRFDKVFILNPSLRSMLVPFFAGVPFRAGFKTGAWFLLNHTAEDKRCQGTRHESEYTLDVLRACGFRVEPSTPKLFPDAEELRRADIFAPPGTGPLVAIHPGASCESKRWPAERFAELARGLAGRGARVAVVGSSEDTAAASRIVRAAGSHAVDMTGRLDLRELAAFLQRCDLLVSNDSGPVHVAAAVGTRTLALYGRNLAGLSVERWRALGEGHEAIRKDAGCVVCLAHECPIGFECLRAIETAEVLARCEAMLGAAVRR